MVNKEKLNEALRDFLVRKRELSGLSQSDVAARSEIYGMGKTLDQRTVSRIERHPMSADFIKIAGYLSAIGIPPQQYYDLLAELTYGGDDDLMALGKKNNIPEQITAALDRVGDARSIAGDIAFGPLNQLKLDNSFKQLKEFLKSLKKKPVIGFFGHFDAGKSTLVNTVINQSTLPARYTPTTSLISLIAHTEDRPSSLSAAAAVFRKGFNPYMMHNSDHVKDHLVEEGDISLLSRLGVHSHDETVARDAHIAMVFSDADILRSVWLLDTPGDLDDMDGGDVKKTLGGVELADGIVFLSSHMGFLNASNLGTAVNVIRLCPPAETGEVTTHMLFVQSHCHLEISTKEISDVRDLAVRRIKGKLDELLFKPWKEDGYIGSLPDEDQIIQRVQPFWRENQNLRTQTLIKINNMSEHLVASHEKVMAENIEGALSRLGEVLLNAVDVLEIRKKAADEVIREIEAQIAFFRKESENLVRRFEVLIGSCRSRKLSDIKSMKDYFSEQVSEEGLLRTIERVYGNDKKAAQNEIGGYIGQLLTVRIEAVLKESGRPVSDEVEEILREWQEAVPSIQKARLNFGVGGVGGVDGVSAFDSNAAFTSGLVGMGALGAMSLYVSSAIASNLGAYILVGHIAGWLTSLGLVGSVTSVTSFVAAIGGPITIGIGLAAAIGGLAYRLIGGSWEKRLSRRVAAQIRKENIWDKVEKPVVDFWDSTEEAISAGLREVRVKSEQHIDSLRRDASEQYDVSKLDACAVRIREAVRFLERTGGGRTYAEDE